MVIILVTMVRKQPDTLVCAPDAHSPRLRSLLETARQQIRKGKGISHADFWQEVEEKKTSKGRGKKREKLA